MSPSADWTCIRTCLSHQPSSQLAEFVKFGRRSVQFVGEKLNYSQGSNYVLIVPYWISCIARRPCCHGICCNRINNLKHILEECLGTLSGLGVLWNDSYNVLLRRLSARTQVVFGTLEEGGALGTCLERVYFPVNNCSKSGSPLPEFLKLDVWV